MNSKRSCGAQRWKVSVVTPSLNQGQLIDKTIRSVLGQDYPHIEYIVVDGLSTDQTHDILRRHEARIDTLIIEKDRGQTNALNKGFRRATGDILAYLNADDCYAHAHVISQVVEYFERWDHVDVIYGRRDYINEAGYFNHRFPYRPFCEEDLYFCDFIPQECTFWTRRIFEKAGAYFDEAYGFAMDYELWLRFLRCGACFRAIPEQIGLFRTYPAQKSIAQWQTNGLTEIARLQQRYLGRSISREAMDLYLKQHWFGSHKLLRPVRELWHNLHTRCESIKGKLFGLPRDGWVYQATREALLPATDMRKRA